MKKIKLRFVHYKNKDLISCQRKTCFGWRDVTYTISTGYGSVTYDYTHTNSEELLLEEILDKYYNTIIKYCKITIYPSILKIN